MYNRGWYILLKFRTIIFVDAYYCENLPPGESRGIYRGKTSDELTSNIIHI